MKIALVLDSTLAPGFLANAAACIASGLFNNEEGLVGEEIQGNGCKFIPITKIPILILKNNGKPWVDLLKLAEKNNLKYMLFTREGQSTTSYAEYVARVSGKSIGELETIGFGVLGEDGAIKSFAGSFPLLR